MFPVAKKHIKKEKKKNIKIAGICAKMFARFCLKFEEKIRLIINVSFDRLMKCRV